jgi:hypothetical protein
MTLQCDANFLQIKRNDKLTIMNGNEFDSVMTAPKYKDKLKQLIFE